MSHQTVADPLEMLNWVQKHNQASFCDIPKVGVDVAEGSIETFLRTALSDCFFESMDFTINFSIEERKFILPLLNIEAVLRTGAP
jgi:hypothetical protein